MSGLCAILMVIQSNRCEIRDDAPRTSRQRVEVIPALLDRRPAARAITIQIGLRPLEFDYYRRHLRIRKLAERRVCRANARNKKLVFHLPRVRAGRLDLIAQPFAEKLIEELRIDRRFLEPREMSVGFKFCPVKHDLVCPVLGGIPELNIQGRFTQQTWNEERSLATDSPHEMPLLRLEKPRPVWSIVFPSRHAWPVFRDVVSGGRYRLLRHRRILRMVTMILR